MRAFFDIKIAFPYTDDVEASKRKAIMSDYKEKVLTWLADKWKPEKRVCDICGENNWFFSEDITTPVVLQNQSVNLGGNSYPQLMAICIGCGNTRYFNVALMNILKDTEADG